MLNASVSVTTLIVGVPPDPVIVTAAVTLIGNLSPLLATLTGPVVNTLTVAADPRCASAYPMVLNAQIPFV
jgi:hypothetical protein